MATLHLMTDSLADAWMVEAEGAVAFVSGVAHPPFNGVFGVRTDVKEEAIAELLDLLEGTRLPHCLQVRPGTDGAISALAEARAMTHVGDPPLMVLDDRSRLATIPAVAKGFAIRPLVPEEASIHAGLVAAAFGAPVDAMTQFLVPPLLEASGVRCYVGEIGNTVVATGMGITVGDMVGVFDIATAEEHRGHGYGAAITAHVVADAMASGAHWALLQSSPMGLAIYERLGFEIRERWPTWHSAPRPALRTMSSTTA